MKFNTRSPRIRSLLAHTKTSPETLFTSTLQIPNCCTRAYNNNSYNHYLYIFAKVFLSEEWQKISQNSYTNSGHKHQEHLADTQGMYSLLMLEHLPLEAQNQSPLVEMINDKINLIINLGKPITISNLL